MGPVCNSASDKQKVALLLLTLPLCSMCAGYREGFLWKRGRDNGQFLSRKFVLSEREGALKYFNKNDVSSWGCCGGGKSCYESIGARGVSAGVVSLMSHLAAVLCRTCSQSPVTAVGRC